MINPGQPCYIGYNRSLKQSPVKLFLPRTLFSMLSKTAALSNFSVLFLETTTGFSDNHCRSPVAIFVVSMEMGLSLSLVPW